MIPRSDDLLVKDVKYNRLLRSTRYEWADEEYREDMELHEAQVRLLRYGEFIETQEKAGMDHPRHFSFMDFRQELVAHAYEKEETSTMAVESKVKYADDMTSRMVTIVPLDVTTSVVKNKKTWKAIENACNVKLENDERTLNKRELNRQAVMGPQAAADGVNFLTRLCQKGMELRQNSMASPVAPGPLATKLVQRGTVATFVEAALSPHNIVSLEAVVGLAQISRVKDCRLTMFQHPQGVQLVHDIISSPNGSTVSAGMLLVTHLLWDEEWRQPILSHMTSGPIEKVTMQWAMYCLKGICKDCTETRVKGEIAQQKEVEKIKGSLDNNVDQVYLEMLAQEVADEMIKAKTDWLKLECCEFFGEQKNRMLCRCLILISTLYYAGTERLVNVNAFNLAVCCLDIPYDADAYAAAAN